MMRFFTAEAPARSTRSLGALLGALLGVVATAACSDGSEPEASTPKETVSVASAELLDQSWPVRMSNDATRQPFEQHAGWGALFQRDLPGALRAFQAEPGDGRALARIHSDLSAVYGEAVWMGAQATRHVYGDDRQDTDPKEADYLFGVARALAGDCKEASEALAKLSPPPEPLKAHHAFWAAWASSDTCPAPPSFDALAALPGAPGAVEAGTDPELPPLPNYTFAEQSDEQRDVESGELTHLFTLSLAHRQAALAAAPEADRPLIEARLSPWQLPILASKDAPQPVDSVDDSWLFLEFALVGADLFFLDAAGRDGLSAVESWKDRSILAQALAPAVTPEGLSVETVIDRAAELRIQLKEKMVEVSGTPMPFQPGFAQMAEVAVLRAGMVVADANDQYRDAGILRINAFERSDGPGRDPTFLLSTAAWDAGNRSPLRAQEIVHGLVSRYPSIRTARYPLDALHIRLGRTAAPSTAVH